MSEAELAIIEALRIAFKRSNEVAVEDSFQGTWASGYWFGKVVALRGILFDLGWTAQQIEEVLA